MRRLEQYLTKHDLWGECLGAKVSVAGQSGFLIEIRFNRAYCGVLLAQKWAPVSFPLADVTLDVSAPSTWGVLLHLLMSRFGFPIMFRAKDSDADLKPLGETLLDILLASIPE
jgi:hypothetical protein